MCVSGIVLSLCVSGIVLSSGQRERQMGNDNRQRRGTDQERDVSIHKDQILPVLHYTFKKAVLGRLKFTTTPTPKHTQIDRGMQRRRERAKERVNSDAVSCV